MNQQAPDSLLNLVSSFIQFVYRFIYNVFIFLTRVLIDLFFSLFGPNVADERTIAGLSPKKIIRWKCDKARLNAVLLVSLRTLSMCTALSMSNTLSIPTESHRWPDTKESSQPALYSNVCICETSNVNILSMRFSKNSDGYCQTERPQLLNVNCSWWRVERCSNSLK